ncbi:unnamed protein product [Macrosiphum euphorbiae]|uniref:BESS domain-containing protein n=1 Tax=Macrosiphum euphorbiae TaxID=13131 RepID=A0AAV0XYM7_9HEMI|nr:unnamed protein product [Macrosiphum euphorbiae]
MEERNPNNDDLLNVDIGEVETQTEAGKTVREPAKKKSKKINLSDVDLENRMGDAFDILKSVSEQPSKDDVQLYTDLLATKLRSFDERTREIIMNNIDNLVFNAKMNNYENSPYQPNSYYDQPMSTLPRIPPIQSNTIPSYTNISTQDKVNYQPVQISHKTLLRQQDVQCRNLTTMPSQSPYQNVPTPYQNVSSPESNSNSSALHYFKSTSPQLPHIQNSTVQSYTDISTQERFNYQPKHISPMYLEQQEVECQNISTMPTQSPYQNVSSPESNSNISALHPTDLSGNYYH